MVKPKTTAGNVTFTKADGTASNVQDTVTALNSDLPHVERGSIRANASTTGAMTSVKFAKSFTTVPTIALSLQDSGAAWADVTHFSANEVTTTGFNIMCKCKNASGSSLDSIKIAYIVIG